MNTILLLIMYQIFNSLLGHLPFSVNFFLHFYGVTFFGTPNIVVVVVVVLVVAFVDVNDVVLVVVVIDVIFFYLCT